MMPVQIGLKPEVIKNKPEKVVQTVAPSPAAPVPGKADIIMPAAKPTVNEMAIAHKDLTTPSSVPAQSSKPAPAVQPQPVKIAQEDIFNVIKSDNSLTPRQKLANYAQAIGKNGYDVNLGEIVELFNNGESEAQKEKRLKRERNARIVSALGDLFGNIINYTNTRHGAPDMKLHKNYDELTKRQKMLEDHRQKLADKDFAMFYNAMKADKDARIKLANQAKADAMKAAGLALRAKQVEQAGEAAKQRAKQAGDALQYRMDRDAANDAYRREKDADDRNLKKAGLDETKQHNRRSESIASQRNTISGEKGSRDYTHLYLELLKNGGINDVLGLNVPYILGKFRANEDTEALARSYFEKNPKMLGLAKDIIRMNNQNK